MTDELLAESGLEASIEITPQDIADLTYYLLKRGLSLSQIDERISALKEDYNNGTSNS